MTSSTKKTALGSLLSLVCLFATAALDGELVYTEGDVSITRDFLTETAEIGTPVYQGDVVRTERDSFAIISLDGGGAEIKLRENTVLEMESLSDNIKINLRDGGAFSHIVRQLNRRYEVQTDVAVAAVRGTEFFVAYGRQIDESRDIWLCVNTGQVEVAITTTGETVIVEEGKGINIVGGVKLTTPRPYSWTRKLNWNTNFDAGDVEDTTDLDQAYSDLLDQDYD